MIKKTLSRSVLIAILLFSPTISSFAGVISGKIRDSDSGEPISLATIRVEGTGRSMLANDHGEYRLRLKQGKYVLKFSHIAYYSEKMEIAVPDSTMHLDVRLRPSMIKLKPIRVYERKYDPAQKIIIEAIRRKDEILSKIKDYSFDAYVKMVIRDTAKDEKSDIFAIIETQAQYFWEYPDTYKEIIKARRTSANINPENVFIAAGGVMNLNLNRIDLGEFSVVSPTARDALEYYNYYLLDTIYIDSLPVFRLEIEPRTQSRPLLVGTILIADSSYAVAGVDVGFNDAVDWEFIRDIRIGQTFAQFSDQDCWMPVQESVTGLANLGIPVIPVFSFDFISSIYNYSFNQGHPKGTFGEYMIEVAEGADDIDSLTWAEMQKIPLTDEEIYGYKRLDSIKHAPKPILKRMLLSGAQSTVLLTDYDFFHFNRVEGPYLGAGLELKQVLPRLDVHLKTGWAFKGEYWQHNYGFDYTISNDRALKIGAEYHDLIARRPTIMSRRTYNPTIWAITNKTDQLDYYHERGFNIRLGTKLLKGTRLNLGYNDYNQYSARNNTEYSIFRESKRHRPNPPIAEGKLRSAAAEFVWDSRRKLKSKTEVISMPTIPSIIFKTGVESASPGFIDNDFDFRRYYISILRRQRTLDLGVSSIYVYGGASEGVLPPQRYFTVDFWGSLFMGDLYFKTMNDVNFAGNRAAAIYISHDFGGTLFRKSGLPLIKDIPLTISAHGGVFWTDFNNHSTQPGDDMVLTAQKPYSEIGFGLAGLLPLNMKLYFTWQLSDYDTSAFTFEFGF